MTKAEMAQSPRNLNDTMTKKEQPAMAKKNKKRQYTYQKKKTRESLNLVMGPPNLYFNRSSRPASKSNE